MLQHWRSVEEFLPRRGRLILVGLAGLSLAVGLAEALVLILVVNVSLVAADGGSDIGVELPLVGGGSVGIDAAILAALTMAAVVLTLHLVIARATSRLGAAVLRRVRTKTLELFANAVWARQAAEREGSLQETVAGLTMQSAYLVLAITTFVTQALGLTVVVVGALVVDPMVTLFASVLGALSIVVLRPVGRATRSRATKFVRANSMFAEGTSAWSSLAMEHRLFGVSENRLREMQTKSEAVAQAFAESRFYERAGSAAFRDIALIGLVLAAAAIRLADGVGATSLGAVVLLIVRALSYGQGMNAARQSVYQAAPGLDLLLERLRSLAASADRPGDRFVSSVGRLELRGVSYSYGDHGGLHDVSLTIEPGQMVGVVGPSGGGKSTLVQVLARLRPPTAGSVLVDGCDYRTIDANSWTAAVSVVPQEPRLIAHSVRENIRFFRDDVSDEAVVEAAVAAHIDEEIRSLPNGYDTELGPRGTGVSGGQAQRICIARALARKPELLILDEPTSALDVEAEDRLRETIGGLHGRVTVVIVAHRLTTLRSCDRVLALRAGHLTVDGTLEQAVSAIGGILPWLDTPEARSDAGLS